MADSPAMRMVRKARTSLLTGKPMGKGAFFGHLAMRLELAEDPSLKELMSTDGRTLKFNPKMVQETSPDHMLSVVAHEILHCFPAGTFVGGDCKPIEEYEIGDHAIGHDGSPCEVLTKFERQYEGDLYTIKAQGALPISMTDEHPVLVSRYAWKTIENPKPRRNIRQWTDAEWKPAKNVRVGDWVQIPRLRGNVVNPLMVFQFGNPWSVSQQIRDGVQIDEEIAEFLGWYVAEGWTTERTGKRGDGKSGVTTTSSSGLALANHEAPIAERIADILLRRFGHNSQIYDRPGNALSLVWTSRPLGRWLREECGHGAHNKRIPKCILHNADENILRSFLYGYMSGDGSLGKKSVCFATASKPLAHQVQLAFARLGVLMNLYTRLPTDFIIKGRKQRSGLIYSGATPSPEAFELMGWHSMARRPTRYHGLRDDAIMIRVTSVSHKPFEGMVYNIETSSETYSAGNVVTHNCASLHHLRRGNRDPELYGIAADHVVNLELKDSGFSLPETAYCDPRFKDMAVERVYTILETEQPPSQGGGRGQKGQGGGQGQQQNKWSGGVEDATKGDDESDDGDGQDGDEDGEGNNQGQGMTEAEVRAEQRKWEQATIQAANAAQQQGHVPAFAQRFIQELHKPKVNPWEVLREHCKATMQSDYRWFPPSRRFVSQGLYLPSMRSDDAMGEMVVMIDTSGSIDAHTLQEFANHIGAIKEDFRPEKIHVIYADAAVNHVDTFNRDEELKIKPHGGGGTDFRPAFSYIKKHALQPVIAVYLTDLYGPLPDKAPDDYPVIWACTSGQVAAWGDTIQIKV